MPMLRGGFGMGDFLSLAATPSACVSWCHAKALHRNRAPLAFRLNGTVIVVDGVFSEFLREMQTKNASSPPPAANTSLTATLKPLSSFEVASSPSLKTP